MVAEKAWAKLFGSYNALDGGFPSDTMVYLTGGWRKALKWDPGQTSQMELDKIWNDAAGALKQASHDTPVFISGCILMSKSSSLEGMSHTQAQQQFGLGGDHAYSILAMEDIGGGTRLVKVRNPWGQVEWSQEWGDNDPRWTPELRQRLDMPPGAVDDGTYCMEWNTFTKFFCMLGVVRCFNPTWPHVCLKGAFGPEQPGQANRSQTKITLRNTQSKVYLQLEQCDTRKLTYEGEPELRALLVLIVDAQGQKVHQSEFEVVRTLGIDVDLDPSRGPYEVQVYHQPIPDPPRVHPDNSFYLSAWSQGDISLEDPSNPNALIPQQHISPQQLQEMDQAGQQAEAQEQTPMQRISDRLQNMFGGGGNNQQQQGNQQQQDNQGGGGFFGQLQNQFQSWF
mmetsp:Transcript_22081/g.48012  ORF Transcript_22081/g.48012 Transcript_22081/m.48012 type:complete len:395 (-) Transcript_22081:59-1243(-)